jgi:tripartite-type tricarboxylate transporter receptor subunit TctC
VTRIFALALVLSAFILPQANAQDSAYPNRPVRFVVTAGPGGNPDVLARLLAQRLGDEFGKPFVVENMPGAGGLLAAKSVSSAAADGHTLLLGDSSAMAINVALNPDSGLNPLKDLAMITALATVPTVLVIHPDVPAKTLDEFVALARKQPGKMTYGSAGYGSIHHLTMALFAEQAGIDLLHVPYRGGTALVNGLLTGEIQAGWSGFPNVLSLIESGKLRALCTSVAKRPPSLPNVPTCAELGFSGFDVATMMGVSAPAGTPPAVVARLQAAVAKALRTPEVSERMLSLGIDMKEGGTEHFRKYMEDDLVRYADAVKRLKLSTTKP